MKFVLQKILLKLRLLRDGYFIDNSKYPLRFRTGWSNSIWLMTSNFLIKISFKLKIVRKKDFLNYVPTDIQKKWNRINPSCWDVIEHFISQKKFSEKKKIYFPKINIDNYKISKGHFEKLVFYKQDTSVIIELNGFKSGGYGHLILEIFPILIYLSLKLPLKISVNGLKSETKIYESFAKAYDIKTTDSFETLGAIKIQNNQVIYDYDLNISSDSKYKYPNYNNICLMRNYFSKLNFQETSFNNYIYLGRKKDSSYGRKLDNENELVDKLINLGFKKIYPEDYSFKEQVAIFYNAKIVVGPLGSAMLNTIFCKEKTHVIELVPDLDFRWSTWLVAMICGNQYSFFSGSSWGKIEQMKPEKFKIDSFKVINKIKSIIKSSRF